MCRYVKKWFGDESFGGGVNGYHHMGGSKSRRLST